MKKEEVSEFRKFIGLPKIEKENLKSAVWHPEIVYLLQVKMDECVALLKQGDSETFRSFTTLVDIGMAFFCYKGTEADKAEFMKQISDGLCVGINGIQRRNKREKISEAEFSSLHPVLEYAYNLLAIIARQS